MSLQHMLIYPMAHLKNNATLAIKGKEINSNVPAILISHLAVDVVFKDMVSGVSF